jgi:hypothetical protein
MQPTSQVAAQKQDEVAAALESESRKAQQMGTWTPLN